MVHDADAETELETMAQLDEALALLPPVTLKLSPAWGSTGTWPLAHCQQPILVAMQKGGTWYLARPSLAGLRRGQGDFLKRWRGEIKKKKVTIIRPPGAPAEPREDDDNKDRQCLSPMCWGYRIRARAGVHALRASNYYPVLTSGTRTARTVAPKKSKAF